MTKNRLEPSDVDIEKLRLDHTSLLNPFVSDSEDENSFLRENALGNQTLRLSDTYLLIEKNGRRLLSYVTLYIGSFKLSKNRAFGNVMIKNKPYKVKNLRHMPCLIIGRLATNREDERRGAATLLITYALQKAIEINSSISFPFLVVHAYPHKVSFYNKRGFDTAFTPSRQTMTHTLYLQIFK